MEQLTFNFWDVMLSFIIGIMTGWVLLVLILKFLNKPKKG